MTDPVTLFLDSKKWFVAGCITGKFFLKLANTGRQLKFNLTGRKLA